MTRSAPEFMPFAVEVDGIRIARFADRAMAEWFAALRAREMPAWCGLTYDVLDTSQRGAPILSSFGRS